MNEGKKENELQLELTRMRNPYLEKQFGGGQHRAVSARLIRGANGQQRRPVRENTARREADWKLRRKKQLWKHLTVLLIGLLLFVLAVVFIIRLFVKSDAVGKSSAHDALFANTSVEKPEWTVDYLTPNEYSRPGDAIGEVKNIFVHYTANPGTSAAQNRSYFEQLKDTRERSASAHFIIGYDGEIIQCIPLNEIAYAVKSRNYDSISIECCYTAEDGSFTLQTYDSLVKLLAYLTDVYNLSEEDILRHYDCGGKRCPVYYVENEDAWTALKEAVKEKLVD